MPKPQLSDEEKRRRGTFRADQSAEVYAARRAETVVTGVFLARVPPPKLPLNDIGKLEYERLATLLLNGNKLTEVTCGDCERMAVMHQQMHARLEAGKSVPMDLIKKMDAISVRLRIAEDAPAIANPNQRNKFASIGTANRVLSAFRLRPSQAS